MSAALKATAAATSVAGGAAARISAICCASSISTMWTKPPTPSPPGFQILQHGGARGGDLLVQLLPLEGDPRLPDPLLHPQQLFRIDPQLQGRPQIAGRSRLLARPLHPVFRGPLDDVQVQTDLPLGEPAVRRRRIGGGGHRGHHLRRGQIAQCLAFRALGSGTAATGQDEEEEQGDLQRGASRWKAPHDSVRLRITSRTGTPGRCSSSRRRFSR